MAKQQAKQQDKQDANEMKPRQDSARSRSMDPNASREAAVNEQGDAEEDHVYGLASVLYHALQGVTAAKKYANDARQAGAEELVEFFEECQREGAARAKEAKSLLLTFAESEDEEDEEDDDEDEEDDS
jgi:hypothetical protein